MNINDLRKQDKLSNGSYLICKRAGIETVEELVLYLNTNGDFLKIKNCGEKSDYELIKICIKYSELQYVKKVEKQPSKLIFIYEKLNPVHQQLINHFVHTTTVNLSDRANYFIMELFPDKISMPVLIEKVYDNNDFNINDFKFQKNYTKSELKKYFEVIKSYFKTLQSRDGETYLIE
jgi:hypothetical protein